MKFFLAVLTVLLFSNVFGQAGSVDTTFNDYMITHFGDGSGPTNYLVRAAAEQPDGKIVIAGAFSHYNGIPATRIARINSDGGFDHTFNIGDGANYMIQSLVTQPDGKIIAVGGFSSFQGQTARCITRFYPDGNLDPTFTTFTSIDGAIVSAALQSDGRIVICGYFTSINGVTVNHVARLNQDGSPDLTFNTGTGANNEVFNVGIRPDGKIVLAGLFTQFNGSPAGRLIVLNQDGTVDNTFLIGTGLDSGAGMIVQPDGKIVLYSNSLINVNGIVGTKICRLNTNGTIDTNFGTNIGTATNLMKVILAPNGKLVVIGTFSTFNGIARNDIAVLNSNGTLDLSFNPGSGVPSSESLEEAFPLLNGNILIHGYFQTFNAANCGNFTSLNPNGSIDPAFKPAVGINSEVKSMALQPDQRLVMGGTFTFYNGVARNHVCRVNDDGSIDNSFAPASGANGEVNIVTLQPDGKILIGGTFTTYDGNARSRIARINSDGTIDLSFNAGTGPNGAINDIAVQPSGKILVSGLFTQFNGVTKPYLIRLNADGSFDPTFNSGTGANNVVRKITVMSDGKFFISGSFTTYNTIPRNNFARIMADGALDSGYNPFVTGNVGNYAVTPDGSVYISSSNFYGNPQGLYYITRRYHADGSTDFAFTDNGFWGSGINTAGYVSNMAPLPNGQLIYSTDVSGNSAISRVNSNGTPDYSFPNGVTPGGLVKSMLIRPDGKIMIAGSFTSYTYNSVDNPTARFICRLNNDALGFSQIQLAFNTSEMSCSEDAIIHANAYWGVPPYNYVWQPGQSTADSLIANVPGIYSCTVTDNSGHTKTASLYVTGPNTTSAFDLKVNLLGTAFRPGFTAHTWLNAFNDGCMPASGQLKLVPDPLTDYAGSNPTPSIISGDTLIWTFSDLTYDSTHITPHIEFTTSTLATIGDSIHFQLIMTPLAGDADTTNNIKHYSFPVVNGYDPNIKSVYPVGECVPKYVDQDQPLTYTVQFQNTGNSEAINISVVDSLDADLDLGTFRILGSSHDVWTEVHPDNVLEFHFDQIHLIDSASNETESHGYVIFSIKPAPASSAGATIANKAAIYFDFNPPVITNEVVNTLSNGSHRNTHDTVIWNACNTYLWNGQNYTESGIYTFATQSSYGCDSLATLHLTIHPNTSPDTIDATSCGQHEWNQQVLTESGLYQHTALNVNGCDSLSFLNLTIHPVFGLEIYQSACEQYIWNGQTFTQSGNYILSAQSTHGCDSTTTLLLTIYQPDFDTLIESACGHYDWNGTTYNQSGSYNFETQSSTGCDSTATLYLTIHQSTSDTITESSCTQYSWNGQTYTESGSYTYTTENVYGCDSTATLLLNILENSSQDVFVDTIDSYTLNGITYSVPGTYSQTLLSANGCDSTLTLHLSLGYTGITDHPAGIPALFPNPTSGQLTIDFGADLSNATVVLTDAQGKIVARQIVSGKTANLNLEQLDNGMYFLSVADKNGKIIHRNQKISKANR